MIALDILKLQLNDFFERSKPQTISKTINKEELYFNQSLFELEKHLFDLKEKYRVNQKLNNGIISANILDSFYLPTTFFRSNDYALSFLVFLTLQKGHSAEKLLETINEYLLEIKDRLTFHDILITDTGATRCYTNIRFTVNELRKYGLLYNQINCNNIIKRTLLPTPLGYLISLYVNKSHQFDVSSHLPHKGNSSNSFVPSLYAALRIIKNSPDIFLENLIKRYEGINQLQDILKTILDDYYNDILQFIEINDKGLKVDESGLEKSMKSYYAKMRDQVEISKKIKNIVIPLTLPESTL